MILLPYLQIRPPTMTDFSKVNEEKDTKVSGNNLQNLCYFSQKSLLSLRPGKKN